MELSVSGRKPFISREAKALIRLCGSIPTIPSNPVCRPDLLDEFSRNTGSDLFHASKSRELVTGFPGFLIDVEGVTDQPLILAGHYERTCKQGFLDPAEVFSEAVLLALCKNRLILIQASDESLCGLANKSKGR